MDQYNFVLLLLFSNSSSSLPPICFFQNCKNSGRKGAGNFNEAPSEPWKGQATTRNNIHYHQSNGFCCRVKGHVDVPSTCVNVRDHRSEASRCTEGHLKICIPWNSVPIYNRKMDSNKHLLSMFMKFPYPMKSEIDYLTVVTKFSEQDITVWLAAQRLLNGISWAPEDVQLAREQRFVTRCTSKVTRCSEFGSSNLAGRHQAAKTYRSSAGSSSQAPVPETFQSSPDEMHHLGCFNHLQGVKNHSPTLHDEQDLRAACHRNSVVIKAETPKPQEYYDSRPPRCAYQVMLD
uniref:Uncharacterized protein n=1 Tax=Eptatretus burgeri TaxID=7764 RepID=A0A8C4R6B6_EPTBU